MAAARGQTPPVNLKERIAALQQRSVSPNTHQSAQATPRGLPSPGSGGLRDKIAKFEQKGGVPVPRGSFAMGAPQLAENAPTKKRGELYGNRLPGLGRPSGAPVGSRSGSPLPSSDESPAPPRKRCISTGAALSTGPPSSFSTNEPVPSLPNGLPSSAHRRNSIAVNFGSARRVMSTSEVEGRVGDPFVGMSSPPPPSVVPEPEQPPLTIDSQPPIPEAPVDATPMDLEQPRSSSPETIVQPPEPPPVVLHTDPGGPEVDIPAEDPPNLQSHPVPLCDAVLQSPSTPQGDRDGLSDYESAPQSAVSRRESPPLPPIPSDVPSATPTPPPTSAGTAVVSPPTPPLEKVTQQVPAFQSDTAAIPAPTPKAAIPPSILTSDPTTDSQSPSKSTFKAVVHRKVTELPVPPAPSTLAPSPPRPPKQPQALSRNAIQVSPSPGYGDLAVLLEDAALLELRLTEGDGTGLKAKDPDLLDRTPTAATFQPDPRQASPPALADQASMPSLDSGSLSVRSLSVPSIREPLVDGEIPEEEETDGRSLASTTFSHRSPSHRKYLSNIYRLTSRRSSSYMPGSYPRDSMSMSSEDSSPVTTPSDNGKRKGFGIAWPSASPKKGGPNISRSSSFADKIFNRTRTKSNVSTTDQDRNSLYESSQPSLSLSFPSELLPETHPDGMEIGARPTSWISRADSNSEFSPSSPLDKEIFDAFPSVPQTLPPGFHLDAENAAVGRGSTLSVNGRKQVNPRLPMA